MPFEPPMTPIIASSQMTRTRADGVKVAIRVNIGTPTPIPPEANMTGWYATLQILGIQNDSEVFTCLGNDSAQALGGAICFPGVMLSAMPFAHEIDFSNIPNFGFPIWPVRPSSPAVGGSPAQAGDPVQE